MTEKEARNNPEMKTIMLLSGYVRELSEGADYETTTYKLAKTLVKVFSQSHVSRIFPVIKETALRCKIIFPTNENEEKMFEEGMEPKKCQKKYYADLFKLLNELGN